MPVTEEQLLATADRVIAALAGPTARVRDDQLAAARALVVEVDGPHHDDPEQRARDAERDAELLALGYTVLHIPRWLVQSDPEAVRARLLAIRQGARIA